MKRSNKKGFTIVELVIVIAIIAILAAVLIPTFASLIQKANESNDIQAAKNMNTFLAMANVTDGVDSILDVYDLFESSGYSVESYKPLYAGRSYYYDKQANQIVYVDDATGKILYPTERKDQLQGEHDWMSLSLTMPKTESITYDTKTEGKTTATVSKPEQYAWVVEEYNNGKIEGELEIKLTKDLDFKGAMCVIHEAKGNITIDGGNKKIKNITSNIQIDPNATHNGAGIKAAYYSGGIVAKCSGGKTITVKNVTFENINVKSPTAGQVGVVIGCLNGNSANAVFENVTLKNCSVIGHRDVGSLVGGMQSGSNSLDLVSNITLDNVKVKTTGGRSGLVVGKAGASSAIKASTANFTITNSAMSIYEDSDLEQKFADGSELPTDWNPYKDQKDKSKSEIYCIEGQDKYIYTFKGMKGSEKAYSAYGYKGDALVLVESKNSPENDVKVWTAITTVDALKSYNWAN